MTVSQVLYDLCRDKKAKIALPVYLWLFHRADDQGAQYRQVNDGALLTYNEIAASLNSDWNTVQRHIKKLEHGRYIRRTRSELYGSYSYEVRVS